MKRMLIVFIGIAVCLLAACSPQPIKTIGADKYYAKIDDSGKKYDEQDNTRYKYELTGYDKNGEKKQLTFTAGHRLKQGKYLQIYYKKNEVITYEEVKDDDIPKEAQKVLGD